MCGIVGILAFSDDNKTKQQLFSKINSGLQTLSKRGPDNQGVFCDRQIALAQTRLSIIDISEASNQPFILHDRYVLIFNGEIYNFKSLRKELQAQGISFFTQGDTEVLLQSYIHWGKNCLQKLNGFFAFAIYDKQKKSLLIARDRMGIKPLLIYQNEHQVFFASEMKALLKMGIPKNIDSTSLFTYLQLNYIPQPHSIFEGVKKLLPGNYIYINNIEQVHKAKDLPVPIPFYEIPYPSKNAGILSYEEVQKQLLNLLEEAIQLRLISDVPLGAFLSGGIDSSIITALASRHTKQLNTFSIGFKDEPFFDETYYAEIVAKKFKTNHHVFSLTTNDMLDNLLTTLDYIDEPFADASALAVNILSKQVRQKVTVALSGDGADELFAGYHKYNAEYKAIHSRILSNLVKNGAVLWKHLPQSRNNKFGNIIRQLHRFAQGVRLNAKERYWFWASLMNEADAESVLKLHFSKAEFHNRKAYMLQNIPIEQHSINDILKTDVLTVLPGDMLF